MYFQSMVDDELVKKYHLSPPGSGGSVREAAVIFKLASELVPEVRVLYSEEHFYLAYVFWTRSKPYPSQIID